MGFWDLGASGLLDTATNAIFKGVALKKQNELAQQNFEYQKGIDERNFNYEKALQQQIFNREDTAFQRAVADAQAAGLSKGVVSSGASSGAVLGTSSSSAQNNMDWSSLGNFATNFQQRKINALTMRQMNADYSMSTAQRNLLRSQNSYYDAQSSLAWAQYRSSPFSDVDKADALRDASFNTLMAEQEQKRKAAEYYSAHPWLQDVMRVGGDVLSAGTSIAVPFIPRVNIRK